MADPYSRQLREKVPVFHDRPNESILTTLEEFRAYSLYEGWNDAQKMQKIIGFLGGRARKRFMDRIVPANHADWDAMKTAIVQEFSPQGGNRMWASAFSNRNQNENEPAANFLDSLQTLAVNAYPMFNAAQRDEIVRGHFVTHLREPLSTFLNTHMPMATLAQLELAATNFENAPKISRGVEATVQQRDLDLQRVFMGMSLKDSNNSSPGPSHDNSVNVVRTREPTSTRGGFSFRGQRSKGRGGAKWTPDGRPICLGCGQAGHMRKNCNARANNQPRFNQNRFGGYRGQRHQPTRGSSRPNRGRRPVHLLQTSQDAEPDYEEYEEETEDTEDPYEEIQMLREQNRRLKDRLENNCHMLQVFRPDQPKNFEVDSFPVEFEDRCQNKEEEGQVSAESAQVPALPQGSIDGAQVPDVLKTQAVQQEYGWSKQQLDVCNSRNHGNPRAAPEEALGQGSNPEYAQVPALNGKPGDTLGQGSTTANAQVPGIEEHGWSTPQKGDCSASSNQRGNSLEVVQVPRWSKHKAAQVTGSQLEVKPSSHFKHLHKPLLFQILFGVICFLLGNVVLAANVQQANLHFCPGDTEMRIWSTPKPTRLKTELKELKMESGYLTTMKIQLFEEDSNTPTVKGTICKCIMRTLRTFHGIFGNQYYSDYYLEPINISELDCHRMINSKLSPYGPLITDGQGWSTGAPKWSNPAVGFQIRNCCKWRTQQHPICFIRQRVLSLDSWSQPFEDMGPTCNKTRGICYLNDSSILIWAPPTQEPSVHYYCLQPVGQPVSGIANIREGNFGMLMAGNKNWTLTRKIVWVSLNENSGDIISWRDHSRLLDNGFDLNSVCGSEDQVRTADVSTSSGYRRVRILGYQNTTAISKETLQLHVKQSFEMRQVEMRRHSDAYLFDPQVSFYQQFQWPNVSVVSTSTLIATQQCYTRENTSFRFLTDTEHWPSGGISGRQLIVAMLSGQWIFGYLDPRSSMVFPQSEIKLDNITQFANNFVGEWRYTSIGLDNLFHTNTLDLPAHVLSAYHPYLERNVWPLLSKQARMEFRTFQRRIQFTNGEYPMTIEMLWLIAFLIYGTLVIFILHCCPIADKLLFCVNPSLLIRKMIQRRCSTNCQYRPPGRNSCSPVQRRRRDTEVLLVRTAPEPTLPRAPSRNLDEIMFEHYKNMPGARAYTGTTTTPLEDEERITAACTVQIGNEKFKGLLDTGATLSLISQKLLPQLDLTSEPDPNMGSAQALSRHEVPLNGRTKADIRIGRKVVKQQDLYVVEDLGDFDLLLGSDGIKNLGPTLFDFDNSRILIYDKPPRAKAEKVAIVSQSNPVKVEEDVLLLSRAETVFTASSPKGLNIDYMFLPSESLIQKKGVRPTPLLVRPQNKRVPMKLLNETSEDIKLYLGTTLGKLYPLAVYAAAVQPMCPTTRNKNRVSTINRNSPPKEKQETNPSGPSKGQTSKDHPLNQVDFNGSILNPHEKKRLLSLLWKYQDVFSQTSFEIGCIPGVEHSIDTGDHPPIRRRAFRTPFAKRQIEKQMVEDYLKSGVIRPSTSPWAQPVVLVEKKDKSQRMCVDYRSVNAVSKSDSFPLPLIREVLDSLGGARYFSSFDVTSGYHHIKIKEEDIPKTAFITCDGLYEWLRMPFGLKTAPATFQRAMQTIMSGLTPEQALVYLDDILVFSKTFDEHMCHLEAVLERFRKYKLKIKAKKCHFCLDELEYLGHVITPKGLKPDPKKIMAVSKFPRPQNALDIQRFLGLAGYYRRFVRDFAAIARPLFALTRKDVNFKWTADQEEAFQTLKTKLTTTPVLTYPRFDRPFVFETDASFLGLGCVVSQEDAQGVLKPVAYASRALKDAERNYSITELECLAVTYALNTFRPYAYGKPCKVITDHQAIKWLFSQNSPSGRLNRWSLALQEYQLEIIYRPGRKNEKADALSRAPVVLAVNTQNQLDLLEAQKNDKFTKMLAQYLDTGILPDDPWLKRDVKRLAPKLTIGNGYVLLKDPHYRRDQANRIFVPEQLRQKLIEEYHASILGGHLGVAKTSDRLRLKYFWPGMFLDVQHWVLTCHRCQERKRPVPANHTPVQQIESTTPWELVEVDVMELPLTLNGNKYVVVFVDHFSKYVEAFAVPEQSATTIAKLLFNEIICRHGPMKKLLSDRGKNFLSDTVKSLCELMRIKKVTSTSYSPQTQGLVERQNRSLQDILSKLIEDKHQQDWDDFLSAALFAARHSVQETTRETPYYLLYGKDSSMPVDRALNYPISPYVEVDDLPYTEALQYRLTKAWKHAKPHRSESHDGQPPVLPEIKEQDLVLLRTVDYPGRAAKLGRPWRGPWWVTKVYGNQTLDIQDYAMEFPPVQVHRRRVKPYHPSPDKNADKRGDGDQPATSTEEGKPHRVDPAAIDTNLQPEASDEDE